MDTAPVRQQIAQALEHEHQTGTLGRLVENGFAKHMAALPDSEIKQRANAVVDRIAAYVTSAADLLDAAHAAAEAAGVADAVGPMLASAVAYVHEDIDFIPDSLGLAGLIDDAYIVHGLVQELSGRHEAAFGKPLVSQTDAAESQRMRRLIGEPTATRLDVAVVAFTRRQTVSGMIEQIFTKIHESGGLAMKLPVAVAFPDDGTSLDDLPSLELGTLTG